MLKINRFKKLLGIKNGLMQDYFWSYLKILPNLQAQIHITIWVKFNWMRTTMTLILKIA